MSDAATPENAAAGLIGLEVWGAQQGHGSFLTLEFGDRKPDDPERGAYHLWIYLCAWRIEHGDMLGAGSEDSEERIAASLGQINDNALTAITFERPSLSTTFEFGKSRLITFEIYTNESEDDRPEQWMLFRPDNMVLSVGPGASWRLSPADQP